MHPPERDAAWWRRAEEIFHQALAVPPEQREAWVADACADAPGMSEAVSRLLAHASDTEAFVDRLRISDVADAPASIAQAVDHAIARPPVDIVSTYRVVSLLGRGGMGSVWLGERHDEHFAGRAAIKFLNPAAIDSVALRRFTEEGRILARLAHPGIAYLIDAGVTPGGVPYLLLEYVEGEPIDRYADARQLDIAGRIDLFLQVLDAIAHAHAALVVHRDIKPSNVFVRPDGHVKLLDFGIAKLLVDGATGAPGMTADGASAMTPEFAAPEQVTGDTITTRTDVYALGVLLYQLLTGCHPFAQLLGRPRALFNAIVETRPPLMSAAARAVGSEADAIATRAARRSVTPALLARGLAGDLDLIVAKALKKSPGERYDSVQALADDLRRWRAHQPVQARPDSLGYRASKWFVRHRVAAILAGIAAIAVVSGTVVAVWQGREAARQRDRAFAALDRSQALTEFYGRLLSDAGAPNAPLTIDGIIARSDNLLGTEFTVPEQQASILLAEASYYLAQDRVTDAEQRSRRAVALLADSGDVDFRAMAQCVHGYALTMAGQVEEGLRSIEAGLAGPTDAPDGKVDCHVYRSYVAQNLADGEATERHARLALEGLRAGRPQPHTEAIALSNLAYGQQLLGRIAEADRSYANALAFMTSIKQDRTPSAATLLNNWGIVMLNAGVPARALQLWERSRAIFASREQGEIPGYLLHNLGRAHELLGHFDQALDFYGQALMFSEARGRANAVWASLGATTSALLQQGELRRARETEVRLRTALAGVSAGEPNLTSADLLTARLALADTDYQDAWDRIQRLLPTVDRRPGQSLHVEARLYLSEAAVGLRHFDDAVSLATDAIARADRLRGGMPFSRTVGLALLALARAHQGQGHDAEARAAAEGAMEQLAATVDASHPALEAAQQLARPPQ